MSALTDEISAPVVIHAKWLKQFGSWNTKRTRATTNIFCVPNNLLCGIINKNAISISEATVPYQLRPDVEEKGRTCRACKLTFLEQCDQQQHFKTELHRINLKRNLVGLEPLEKITAEAPSGSSSDSTIVTRGVHFADEKKPGDSSSDEEEEEEIDHIYSPADYFDDEMIESDSSAARNPIEYVTPEGVARKHLSKQDGPQYVFSSSKESLSTWDFSVSVGALHEASSVSTFDVQPWTLLAETIQTLQDKSGSMWCVLILRSGRFAGAVFDGSTVLTHKVLRRYTVRAKAGGSQSSHDGQGKNAKSVGAMLRRYGEQALTEDVRALLKDWGAQIQSCSAIFLSCPKTMRSVIFEDGAKEVPVRRNDPRVRLVPFMVKKPTFEEVKLVHTRLSTVTFQLRGSFENSSTHETSDSAMIADLASAELLSLTNIKSKSSEVAIPVPELPKCSSSIRLFAACVSGDQEVVAKVLSSISSSDGQQNVSASELEPSDLGISYSDSYSNCEDTIEQEQEHWDVLDILNMPSSLEGLATCLHVASELGFGSIVYILLMAGADPTRLDVRGRPPYFLAKTKEVRDAFRRARCTKEELFAWDAAGVPAALTDEMEKQQREKEKEKKKRSKLKKKEKDERDAEEVAQAEVTRCEQKASAGEEAIKRRASAGVCAQCLKSLFGLKPLDLFDRRCCSSACVLLLRRRLAVEAAEKRFAVPS